MGELQKNISELAVQNKRKHTTIITHKPSFPYVLYKISDKQAISKAFGKELLLKQMDRLLEEKNFLDRELSKIHIEEEEKEQEKQSMVENETQHFELLKSIWGKEGRGSYSGTLEHMEELNAMVGQIRGNIKALIRFEANDTK